LAVRPEFEKLRRWNTMLRPMDYTHAVELWCVADSWVSYVYMWMMRTTKWIYILCCVLCIELLGICVSIYIYIYLLFLKWNLDSGICKLFKYICSNGSAKVFFFKKNT
jgi:hypothetical protein